MLCHVPKRSRLPILFPQDAYFITFMLLFAVSNGYLMSLTMCLAPRSGGWWGRAGGKGSGPACKGGPTLLLASPALAAPSLAGATLSGQVSTAEPTPGQQLGSGSLNRGGSCLL